MPTVVCPTCKVSFGADVFKQHVMETHPRPSKASNTTIPAEQRPKLALPERPERPQMACPTCQAMVFDLGKHQRKVHNPAAERRRAERAARDEQRRVERKRLAKHRQRREKSLAAYRRIHPDGKVCGLCEILVPDVSELDRHLRVEHGFNIPTVEKPVGVASARAIKKERVFQGHGPVRTRRNSRAEQRPRLIEMPVPEPRSRNPYEQARWERQMDATYGMGGTARDHGQFGSAASYDGMDDEASP